MPRSILKLESSKITGKAVVAYKAKIMENTFGVFNNQPLLNKATNVRRDKPVNSIS